MEYDDAVGDPNHVAHTPTPTHTPVPVTVSLPWGTEKRELKEESTDVPQGGIGGVGIDFSADESEWNEDRTLAKIAPTPCSPKL